MLLIDCTVYMAPSYKNGGTVHPRLSEQVELKFLLGRSDTQKIRIIEEKHITC